MKFLISFLITLLLVSGLLAQDVAAIIKEGDRLEAMLNEKAAFAKFKDVLKLQPANIYSLNKCSELCSRIGKRETSDIVRNAYYEAAKTYAGIALKISPTNAEANCVLAIALGRISMNSSGKEKIKAAKEIRKHVDIAIKSDPLNYKAWHVLGRWHFEISSLNIFEKAAVKLLFGSLPPSSIEESIKAFEKANTLASGFVLNNFEMARAYKKDGQKQKAIAILKAMMNLPNTTEDDITIKSDGRKLLNEWL
jgi:tetratricopeptide (TPR) repeat protein